MCHLPEGPSSWGPWSGAGRGRGACVGLARLPFSCGAGGQGRPLRPDSSPTFTWSPRPGPSRPLRAQPVAPAGPKAPLRRHRGSNAIWRGSRSKVGGWGPAGPAAQAGGRALAGPWGSWEPASGFESAPCSAGSIVCVGGDGMFSEVLHGLVGRTQRDAGVDQNQPRATLVPSPLRIGIIPAGKPPDAGLCPLGAGSVHWAGLDVGVCLLGMGWMGVCPRGGGAVHGGRGLSTGGGVDGVCSLGRGQASRCVHWAGPGVGSRPRHAGWSSGCVLGAGPAGRPCLPSGSLHFRRALLPTHLTRGHGCAGRGAVSSPGPRFPPRGACGLCSQRAGRWWGVGSGGPEHSGGEGEPGEQAAAWKTRLVPGAGGWVSGRGPRGVRWLACPELAASACFMTGKSTSFSRRTHCSKGVGVRLGLCVHLTGRGRPPRPCLGRSSRDPGGSGSGVNGAVAPSSS